MYDMNDLGCQMLMILNQMYNFKQHVLGYKFYSTSYTKKIIYPQFYNIQFSFAVNFRICSSLQITYYFRNTKKFINQIIDIWYNLFNNIIRICLFQFINYLLFQKYEKIQIYLNNRYMVQFVKNLFYNNQSFNKQYIKQTKNLQNKFKFFSNFQVFRSYSHFFKTFGERRSWFDVVVNIVPTRLYIYVSYIQMTGLQIFDFLGRQILILVQQIIIICNMHLKHVC
eukprot:TRINITY_DN5348_c0_g1_i2.p1 TRINITY_DN5348_c0_g1~~TRINITY_DN5348_c0_g1_i2.p1  ORF type:complete len:225 (-),score=-18.14 TRINITY_DN5348_c0_g1_i2:180-854(-)